MPNELLQDDLHVVDAVRIEMHAVIPVGLWQWNEKSKVYIRFGLPQLGNWKFDYGPGIRERYVIIMCVMMLAIFFKINDIDSLARPMHECVTLVVTFCGSFNTFIIRNANL